MKISVLLPYKENFSTQYAGAVSLLLKDTIKLSKFKSNIKVFGSTNYKNDILIKNYINLNTDKFFFQSRSNIYIKNFIKHENKIKSDLIEIHNRPNYINKIFQINKKLVLYFHNDPLEIKGSKSIRDRINILKKTKKIIFISNWLKKRFFKGINNDKISNKHFEIIHHSTTKKKISLNKKKKFNCICW